jgi:hypothetical protein
MVSQRCYLLLVGHPCLRVVVHGLLRMSLCVSKGVTAVLQVCDGGGGGDFEGVSS